MSIADYINYWVGRLATPLSPCSWLNPDDAQLPRLWVPHNTPPSAAFDPVLRDVLDALVVPGRPGYTRRLAHIEQILAASQCTAGDTVLECFCGAGALTVPLALLTRQVLAVDVDGDVVRALQGALLRAGVRNVEFEVGDIRDSLLGDKLRSVAVNVTKHVHTPSYYVIPETIELCASIAPPTGLMVLPLSLLRREWALRDYEHIAFASEWFTALSVQARITVVRVAPLLKPNGTASSAVFELLWNGPIHARHQS